MNADFWTSPFWSKWKKTFPIRCLRKIYFFSLHLKHIIFSFFLQPYYVLMAQNKETKKEPYNYGQIIISLTSYPARINGAYYAICSLLNQSVPANKIILTLIKSEFPLGEKSLPSRILALKAKGLEILWGEENLRPHNKYFYTMQKYPNAIILTADDDILYPSKTIEKLLACYKKFPNAISALCTDRLYTDGKVIKPYSQASSCYDVYINQPRYDLLAEGYAGVLYPPSILPQETFNKEKIKELAPYADDLWLKFMELLKNIPVVCASKYQDPIMIFSSQKTGLFKYNKNQFGNDKQFSQLITEYSNKDKNAFTYFPNKLV